MSNINFVNEIYSFWFPKNVAEIIVITSEEPDSKKSIDASTTAENYQFLNNVGDIDTLLEVVMFLSKYYPKAKIKRLFPREFNQRDDLDKNLVVIGGPFNNSVCKMLMEKMGSEIEYDKNNWNMVVKGISYDYIYSEERGMEKDYGYFATFENPEKKTNKIVLINGINTFGVLGAFRSFSDIEASMLNYKTVNYIIEKEAKQNIRFECFFEVFVDNCNLHDCTKIIVNCPKVKEENIFFFNNRNQISLLNDNKYSNEFLKTQIGSMIKIAIDKSIIHSRVIKLKQLQSSFNDHVDISTNVLKSILYICSDNDTIPDNSIEEIKKLLK